MIKIRYRIKDRSTEEIIMFVADIIDVECRIFLPNPWGSRNHQVLSRDLFTGLYDKNGKAIYKGDILCWSKYEGTKNQTRWVVKWEQETASFTYWSPRMDAEIIGNIYQNPELLEAANAKP